MAVLPERQLPDRLHQRADPHLGPVRRLKSHDLLPSVHHRQAQPRPVKSVKTVSVLHQQLLQRTVLELDQGLFVQLQFRTYHGDISHRHGRHQLAIKLDGPQRHLPSAVV